MEEKLARKKAKAELKRKYKEELRRHREESRYTISPTKRERLERMAEKQVEQILQAAHVIGHSEVDKVEAPQGDMATNTGTEGGEKDTLPETNKLLM